VQWLASPQPVLHASPSIEHVPPASGQVVVQGKPVTSQVLLRSQSGLVAKHAVVWVVPSKHNPGWVGHSARSVPATWQLAVVTIEQCPEFGHSAVMPGVLQEL